MTLLRLPANDDSSESDTEAELARGPRFPISPRTERRPAQEETDTEERRQAVHAHRMRVNPVYSARNWQNGVLFHGEGRRPIGFARRVGQIGLVPRLDRFRTVQGRADVYATLAGRPRLVCLEMSHGTTIMLMSASGDRSRFSWVSLPNEMLEPNLLIDHYGDEEIIRDALRGLRGQFMHYRSEVRLNFHRGQPRGWQDEAYCQIFAGLPRDPEMRLYGLLLHRNRQCDICNGLMEAGMNPE